MLHHPETSSAQPDRRMSEASAAQMDLGDGASSLADDQEISSLLLALEIAHDSPLLVEQLCGRLLDPNERLRIAAAQALAFVGDERAIEPLAVAIRRCFVGGSRRRQFWLGFGAVVGVIILLPIAASFCGHGDWIGTPLEYGYLVIPIGAAWAWKRRVTRNSLRWFSRALTAIAERRPSPVLRGVVPDLKALGTDYLQAPETWLAAQWAVERIEELTASNRTLPVAVTARIADGESLPRPAAGVAKGDPRLPLVSERTHSDPS